MLCIYKVYDCSDAKIVVLKDSFGTEFINF